MITREQVADLREGDVVEIHKRAPLSKSGKELLIDGQLLRRSDGDPSSWVEGYDLTVVSRAPRPLYVNHHRTEPVAGDVVRDELGDKLALFICTKEDEEVWWVDTAADWIWPAEMREKRLRLLVDGETGQVVP